MCISKLGWAVDDRVTTAICAGLLMLAPAGRTWAAGSEERADAPPDSATTDGGGNDIKDIDLFTLEVPLVITASRREQKATDVPYAMSVVTADDIRQAGARNIPDALRLVPGMDIAELNYGQTAVSPRGFSDMVANQILVLVDGRQIFDSLFGGTLWGSWPFQLEDIERIEVVRGPGGVAWGANAMNGVINIITKDPKDQLGVTVTGGGGSRGMQKEHVGYAFKEGRFRMRVSGEYEGSDGFRRGGSFLHKVDDDYKAGRMNVHSIYEPRPGDKFTLSGGTCVLDGGFTTMPSGGFGLRRNAGSQASFLLGKWSHESAADNTITLTGYVNDFYMSPGVPQIDYRYQQLAVQLGHTFKPADDHTLTWGVDTRTDLVDAGNSDPYMLTKDFVSTANIGVYVQDEWRFAPRWILTLGGRVDYEFYGGFQPSGRISLAHELTKKSLIYAAVSRAFSMGPAALRFMDIPLYNGLVSQSSNRDFDAITLIAYELGYRARPLDRLETNVNAFWHEYDDLTTFSTKLGPPGLLQSNFDNRGDATLYGVECDARYSVTKDFTLLGNYTYQEFGWRSAVPLRDRADITPTPHKFMLGARYKVTEDFRVSSHLYYVSSVSAANSSNPLVTRHINSYFRLDLRAEHEFWKDRASLAVGVRNLLQANHYEGGSLFLNHAAVPRMVYAEMRVHFQ